MRRLVPILTVLLLAGSAQATPRYRGRACPPPHGYEVADCRVGPHGAPDLSRNAWRALYGAEVTISERLRSLALGPDGTRRWALVDSLGMAMGSIEQTLEGELRVTSTQDATAYKVSALYVRGHGCALSLDQQRRFMLLQIIAPAVHGTQAFVDSAAIDRDSADGATAYDAFIDQQGGGTGCGPSRPEIGKVVPLRDPRVGACCHARLGDGTLNTVDEYDAKPVFGNVVYFNSNTTSVHAGGIARGMVRVGTPVAKVDLFKGCDPNSDGTLTWRYVSIRTGAPKRPRLYGWIPAAVRRRGDC